MVRRFRLRPCILGSLAMSLHANAPIAMEAPATAKSKINCPFSAPMQRSPIQTPILPSAIATSGPLHFSLVPTRPQKPNQCLFPFNLQIKRATLMAIVPLDVRQNFIEADSAFLIRRTKRQLRHGAPDGSLFRGELELGICKSRADTITIRPHMWYGLPKLR
jgi:hypothetical protein